MRPTLFLLTEQLLDAWEREFSAPTLGWALMARVIHHDSLRTQRSVPSIFG